MHLSLKDNQFKNVFIANLGDASNAYSVRGICIRDKLYIVTEEFILVYSLDDFNETERQYKRVFAFSSSRYEIDKSGRITLTKDHLSRAAITKEVVIVGNYDHIEIWDRERFEEINKLQDDNFEKNAQSIALERRKTN